MENLWTVLNTELEKQEKPISDQEKGWSHLKERQKKGGETPDIQVSWRMRPKCVNV